MKLKNNIALSDSGFVFDPSTGDSFSLNPIGTEIVKLLRESYSTNQIFATIIEKYDVDEPTLERYFYDFIGTLKQYNLLENGEETP